MRDSSVNGEHDLISGSDDVQPASPALKRVDRSHIKSFIRRQGRATIGQRQALEQHSERYCLDPQQNFDALTVFGRSAPLVLEIGFGNGTSLAAMANARPDLDFIGIEVHRPGVGHLLMLIEQMGLSNVRVYHHDALEILEHKIPDHSLHGLHLFFPDPWHKRRHHKRRIVRPRFVALLERKLASGGYFHAATDWQEYAKAMLPVLSASPQLRNMSEDGSGFCPRPEHRPMTKFEQRGLRLGHGVWDVLFRRM